MASKNTRSKKQGLSQFDRPQRNWREINAPARELAVNETYLSTERRTIFPEKKTRQPLTWGGIAKKGFTPRNNSQKEIRKMQKHPLSRTEKMWLNRTLKIKALIISDLRNIQLIYKHESLSKILQLILRVQKTPLIYNQREFHLRIEKEYQKLNESFASRFSRYR
jgi:hypothetical protein